MNINTSSLTDILFNSNASYVKNGENADKITKSSKTMDETVIMSSISIDNNQSENKQPWKCNEENESINSKIKEYIDEFKNSATPDAYKKFEDLGIIPDQENPKDYLTVSERIQIELALHCDDYVPTGNISKDDIESMYGNSGVTYEIARSLYEKGLNVTQENVDNIQESLNMVQDIDKVDELTTKYLVKNGLPVTIENVYKAQYSTTNTEALSETKISDEDWNELSSQIEDKIYASGFEKNEDTINDARWLVQNNLGVTTTNLIKMSQIRDINNYDNGNGLGNISSNEWIDKMTTQLVFGGQTTDTFISPYRDIKTEAVEATEIINNGTEDQITTLVTDDLDVNLLNMKRVQEENSRNYDEQNKQLTKDQSKKIIAAKRQLEEIRLVMTTSSFATMIKNGIDISVTSFKDLIDNMNKIENDYVNAVFSNVSDNGSYVPNTEEKNLFIETSHYMTEFSNAPSYVLGSVLNNDISFEIQEMTWDGAIKKNILDSAQQSYDTLATKPRKDLGDSLKRAFKGIDDILDQFEMEETSENQRAIRILAYNQMEINQENIFNIKALDVEVSRLVENLTPKASAYLISNGINPLKTDIRKLNDDLDKINENIGDGQVEKYSEFLYKLDKNQSISKEDRKSFINIYKAISKIQRSDRMAVGAVSIQGSQFTINNLVTAVNSKNSVGNEYQVDDSTGINSDELRYQENLIKKAEENISPTLLEKMAEKTNENLMDISIEEFVQTMNEQMTENPSEYNDENKYLYEQMVSDVDKTKIISEQALSNVLEDGLTPSFQNLIAATFISSDQGKTYCKFINSYDNSASDRIIDSLVDENSVDEVVEDISNKIKDKVVENNDIDMMRMVNKTLNYVTKAAGNKSYYVPAMIGNDETTIHLTLRTTSDEKGKVKISMNVNNTNIDAEFTIKDEKVKGLIMSGDNNIVSDIKDNVENLNNSLKDIGLDVQDINIVNGQNINRLERKEEAFEGSKTISNDKLYKTAKAFISVIKYLSKN